MKYIVYKTTNLINNYIYIGVHKTQDPNIFDSYIGCGVYINKPYTYEKAKTKFQQAVKEFGTSNFRRETLAIFDTDVEAYELEEKLVNENFLARPDVYNMVLGGKINTTEGITVFQYDKNGKYITNYNSYEDAGKALKVQASSIRRAVIYKYTVNNYYFNTDKLDCLDLSLYTNNIHKIKVYRYLKSGDYDSEYESYGEAARNSNSSSSNIRSATILGYCVKNLYYFSFIKELTFDKARTKQIMFRSVHKYNSKGEYICSYKSQLDAEKENPYINITKCIKLKTPDENGFIWGLEKLPNYNKPVGVSKNSKKKVGLFDDQGNIIKTWESARQCAKEVGGAVQNVLLGKYKRHKGHIYKYI